MKKILLLMLMITLIVVNTSSCSDLKEDNSSEMEFGDSKESSHIPEVEFEVEKYTFEDVVKNSDIALMGQYIESYEYEYYVEHKFKINEVIYGSVSEAEIYVFANKGNAYILETGYSYEMDANVYEQDKEYLLILEKYESIMYDHDRYLVSAELCLCETDKEYRLYSQIIDFPSELSLKSYILSMVDPSDFQALTETPSTNLTNIDEMVLASEYIGTVKILDLYMEGKVHNGNTYRCKVEALSKGNNLNTYSDGTILLTIRKNVVTVGETYIIGFSPIGEGSLIYVQTSIDGVYEYSDELLKNILER